MQKRTVLIDGDILVYRFAASTQTVVDWGDGVVTAQGDLAAATVLVDDEIEQIAEATSADRVIVALSDTTANFRKGFFEGYKKSRVSTPKPILYGPLREHLIDKHAAWIRPTLEADDILGIVATHPDIVPGEKVIESIDKDLRTIPGLHYHRKRGVEEVTLAQANRFFFTQILTGDRIDCYPGCPGVGPKKAEAILAPIKRAADAWPAVVAAYAKAGLTEDDALVQARCARILRHTDYDFKRKEPILWEP